MTELMHSTVVVAVLLMALATYSTRLIGYLALRGRTLSPRLQKVLDMTPCCVMMAVVAPSFMTTSVADLGALAVAILVSMRKNIALTVIAAVATDAILLHVL